MNSRNMLSTDKSLKKKLSTENGTIRTQEVQKDKKLTQQSKVISINTGKMHIIRLVPDVMGFSPFHQIKIKGHYLAAVYT